MGFLLKGYHLLGKSPKVEAVDKSSFKVLLKIEKSVNQWETLKKLTQI